MNKLLKKKKNESGSNKQNQNNWKGSSTYKKETHTFEKKSPLY